jgi:uncharacterized protein YlxW (UPF0749 family)
VSRQPPPGDLLARLAEQALDDDYAAVAARRGTGSPVPSRSRRATLLAFGASAAVLAVLLTVAAVQTRATASETAADREALISRIEEEQDRVARGQSRVEELADEVDRLRTTSLEATGEVARLEDRLEALQAGTGVVPVSGPGVRITVADAPDGAPSGRIRDTDLQLLANGLWQAGAEAVAVGGQRLTAHSAIRTAGQAITVNYRSLSPPYVVTAIGDPATLPARFLETSAGQAFTDLRANFGVVFALESLDSLTLPGRPLTLSVARPGAGRPPSEDAP